MRWSIAVLVSAAIAISYLDRQTLPVAIGEISRDIPISNQVKAFLDSAFLLTYGLMYVGGGRLMDILGTRRGFLVIMIFWSLACASHRLAGVGSVAWIPFAAAAVGCLMGGGLSSWLLHRGYSVNASRKIALGLSAAMMPCVMFVPDVSVPWVIFLFSVAFFGQQSWSTIVKILPTDLLARHALGTVAGSLASAAHSAAHSAASSSGSWPAHCSTPASATRPC